MPLVTKTTKKEGSPLGRFLSGAAEGVVQGIELSNAMKNAKLNQEKMQQEIEINKMKLDQEQQKLYISSVVGIDELESRVMESEDMKASAELAWPQVQQYYKNRGLTPPGKEEWVTTLKAQGSKGAQAKRAVVEDAYALISNPYNLTDAQFEAKSKNALDALEWKVKNTFSPERRKAYREDLNWYREAIQNAANTRAERKQEMSMQKLKGEQEITKETLKQQGKGKGTNGDKNFGDMLKQVEKEFEDLAQSKSLQNTLAGSGPVAGFFGGVANALGVDTPEGATFEQSLGNFALAYTKEMQGSRPSDFDLKFIRETLLPKRRDADKIIRAKLQNLREMVASGEKTDVFLSKKYGKKYDTAFKEYEKGTKGSEVDQMNKAKSFLNKYKK